MEIYGLANQGLANPEMVVSKYVCEELPNLVFTPRTEAGNAHITQNMDIHCFQTNR